MEHYEQQARDFLGAFGLTLNIAFKGDKCPPWEILCNASHGDRYRVTLRRKDSKSISFDFWNSWKDSHEGKRPTAYDVLACISSDAYAPTDPDEVAEEYGDIKPSQAIAVAKFAKRLQAFFIDDELEALSEIA